jgi:hypothetical protein
MLSLLYLRSMLVWQSVDILGAKQIYNIIILEDSINIYYIIIYIIYIIILLYYRRV